MGFEYLTNVPLEQARKEFLELLCSNGFGPATETIPVWDACGRVTAHGVYASICAPHYAASAMDGVAVSAKDTFGATETTPRTLQPRQLIWKRPPRHLDQSIQALWSGPSFHSSQRRFMAPCGAPAPVRVFTLLKWHLAFCPSTSLSKDLQNHP